MPDGTNRGPSAQDLDASLLVRRVVPPPTRGWRRALYQGTGGRLNVGDNSRDRHLLGRVDQVRQPLRGCCRIALLGSKGGVGKTTTTVTLGSTFAAMRENRVIAVDANFRTGAHSARRCCRKPRRRCARCCATNRTCAPMGTACAPCTSQNRHRLEVLASDSDPAVSEAFSAQDYEHVLSTLERFYNIVLTDYPGQA